VLLATVLIVVMAIFALTLARRFRSGNLGGGAKGAPLLKEKVR